MFFFSLAVFAVCAWILPWWCLSLAALLMGVFFTASRKSALQITASAGLVWAAMAWIWDGHSYGIISHRMAGLFNLPATVLIFVLMAAVGGVTALLSYLTGASVARISSSGSTSEPDPQVHGGA
jgi:hypothetical protein